MKNKSSPIFLVIFILLLANPAYAWFSSGPSGYNYRKQMTITGSTAGAQTNYQMQLTVYKGSGTDSGSSVYLNNHCQDDFDDIRFTKSDGTTLLDYWVESYTSGTSATVWVEFDSIPASPATANFYIYYDNASATSGSNGDNTFQFFDDFSGSSVDASKWNSAGSPTVSGGTLLVNAAGEYVKSINTYQYKAFRFRANTPATQFTSGGFHDGINGDGGSYDGTNVVMWVSNNEPASYSRVGDASTYSQNSEGNQSGAYHIFEALWKSAEAKFYVDDTLKRTYTSNVPSNAINFSFWESYSAGDYYIDWAFVRNYVSPEPTWTSWGDESAESKTVISNAIISNAIIQ
jgi:hypothetical protein